MVTYNATHPRTDLSAVEEEWSSQPSAFVETVLVSIYRSFLNANLGAVSSSLLESDSTADV